MIVTRALRRSDAAAVLRLLTAIHDVDHGEEHELVDIEHDLADPGVDLALDTVGIFDDGKLLAQAQVHVRDTDMAVEGGVDPAVRRRGHGTALVHWVRARGVDRGVRTVSLTTEDSVTGAGRLFEAVGLTPVRRWYSMARDVGPAPGPGEVPPAGGAATDGTRADGVAVSAVTAADSEALRLLHGVAFTGHFGSEPPGPARWEQWYLGSPNWRADTSVVVRDTGGGALLGYALGYEWPADAVASGVREAYLGQLGVDPARRRRGLGSVLLTAFVERAAAAGYGRVALMVDTENASGALAMYEAAGFAVTRTSTTYRGPVDPVR